MQEGNLQTKPETYSDNGGTLFQLKKCKTDSTCVSVAVDFSPFKINSDPQAHHHKQTSFKSTPVFNQDNNYFTPSFILEADKGKYEQNKLIYKQLFEQKVQEADIEPVEMYLPRPSKSNSFCCVCKMIFEDYLTHVNLPIHKKFMQRSQFHAEIKSLCGNFCKPVQQKEEKGRRGQGKTKTVKKQKKEAKASKRRTKKIAIDSVSTSRGHSTNDEVLEAENC